MIDVQTSLEMRSPDVLRAAGPPRLPARLERVDPADFALNRRLYSGVGEEYGWTDRLVWSERQWRDWTAGVETWVAIAGDESDGGGAAHAGFFELQVQPRSTVELAIFGLLPRFHGQGLGGWLLTAALERAWRLHPDGTRRVWVHTRRLDGPAALPNYLARGLRPFDALVADV